MLVILTVFLSHSAFVRGLCMIVTASKYGGATISTNFLPNTVTVVAKDDHKLDSAFPIWASDRKRLPMKNNFKHTETISATERI